MAAFFKSDVETHKNWNLKQGPKAYLINKQKIAIQNGGETMGFFNELSRAFVNSVREEPEESRHEVTVTPAQPESLQIVNELKFHRYSLLNDSQAGDPQASLLLAGFLFHMLRAEWNPAYELTPVTSDGQWAYTILLLAASLCQLSISQGGTGNRDLMD